MCQSGECGRNKETNTYTLNRTKATELALQILLVGIVVETSYNERLEGVAANVGILVRIVCDYEAASALVNAKSTDTIQSQPPHPVRTFLRPLSE
jgi:hypothetical protein